MPRAPRPTFYTPPFTILVDTGEQQPWTFDGMVSDAKDGNRPIVVRTERKYLGATHGDYSIASLEGIVALERKGREDAYSTFLGHDSDRRERFKRELEYLQSIQFGAVIVEASLGDCLKYPTEGKQPPAIRAKQFHRTVLSWQERYKGVQWIFADTRRLAEISAFRLLEIFWRHRQEEAKTNPQEAA